MPAHAQPPPSGRANLAEIAYDRLEGMIVTCTLRPGQFLSIQDLQDQTGLGRTPIHQAVSRLAADTLIRIRPRHGLQIAPINLARERELLALRREMERFVVRRTTERASATARVQLEQIAASLRDQAGRLTIEDFNQLDRRIDRVFTETAGEPFLEQTLRPLHTISRRIGWIYHSWVRPQEGFGRTVECHLAILDEIAGRRVNEAVAASDRLIAFSDSMFAVLEHGSDPALFDCNLALRAAG